MKLFRNNLLIIFSALLITCIVFEFVIYSGYKRLCRDFRLQNSKFETVKSKVEQFVNYYNYHTEYSEDALNYLAIGNSLTIIPEFGHGMCSTLPQNDYFNLILKKLSETNKKVIAYPYNFSVWERNSNRKETLGLLDVYLDNKLNIITIQLGENVRDKTTFEQDFIDLIHYVRTKSPNAKVIIVGDFWNKDINKIRKNVAKVSGCIFADISKIIGSRSYQSKEGVKCIRNDGSTYVVTKDMSTHPGDTGMKYIADEILKNIN